MLFNKNMNDKKIIFVSYLPGCCGQFIGMICEKLTDDSIVARITKTGEVNKLHSSNSLKIMNLFHESYERKISCRVKLNKNQIEVFDNFADTLIQMNTADNLVVALHLICMEQIEIKFPNSKKILIVPENESEMQLAHNLWVHKKNQLAEYHPYNDFPNINILNECASPNVLKLSLTDILNPNMMNVIINRIISHLEIDDKNKESAINFYDTYLKKQDKSILFDTTT